jgi:hypothetical protein
MWTYQGEPFDPEEAKNWFGAVYIICNTVNNRKYIGRKCFTAAGRKTVKGKVKKIRKDSDWLTYYGSSDELKADIERLGKDQFTREIVKLVKTRGELAYWESKYIFDTEAILRSSYYNGWVTCKISSGHVKSLWIDDKEPDDKRPNGQNDGAGI